MAAFKEHWWLKLRRLTIDGELSARILKLPKSSGTSTQKGLIMIQIDGLSKTQLENAINRGEVPFIKKLMTHEKYKLHNFYTGVPSTTPAVQGELFYGVKSIVPAFHYFDQIAKRPFKMLEWKAVEEVEKRLQKKGKGLLEGGSSYSNIFSGGAKETHFCAVSLGLSKIWKKINLFRFILFIFIHLFTFIRIAIYSLREMIIGLIQFLESIWKRENIRIELNFIFLRISICVILRELITLGTRIDIARGLPIIHLNFLGYDEHAHHRGPSSYDAHNALKTIDQSIRTIYKSALRSSRRQYDVWIYSDHGQIDVDSYHALHGKTVSQNIKRIYAEFLSDKEIKNNLDNISLEKIENLGVQFSRAKYLGHWIDNLSILKKDDLTIIQDSNIMICAIGPTGQIYLKNSISYDEKKKLAQKFIDDAHIPIVMIPLSENKVRAWNKDGEFILPDQTAEIIGTDHPYLNEISHDLVELCHHEHAGDFTICGWKPNSKPISFPLEHGAHAGPGIGETDAFALLPSDISLSISEGDLLKTQDLRRAALKFLNREPMQENQSSSNVKNKNQPKSMIRLMTYNVHSCVGIDGKLSHERIARVIARHEPDIVALQELDVGRRKTNALNQPHLIAQQLEMLYHFHPAIDIKEEKYGNAILSRYPIDFIAAKQLPTLMDKYHHEPRGALWVRIKVNNSFINIITTHLGLNQLEANKQAKALAGVDWLTHPQCQNPTILCGDFNSTPHSACWKILNEKLQDAQLKIHPKKRKHTWFSRLPMRSIDHVFVSQNVNIINVDVSRTQLDQQASDHLPLIIDFNINV